MIRNFDNPPAENRPRPFWFWNGEMTRPEIRRQILEMKDKGLGGFFLCARQGLRVPYLSQEWFALCRYAVDTAREQGLEVWLYDEFPYPSGMSGGRVTLMHPEARHSHLDIITSEAGSGQAISIDLGVGLLVRAQAFPLLENGTVDWDQGLDLSAYTGVRQNHLIYQRTPVIAAYAHNTKRFFSYGPTEELYWTPPAGSWKIIIAMSRTIEDFKYFGTYLDPVNRDAVQAFRETTYEAYKKELGEYFSSTIKGMFTDETCLHGRWSWSNEIPASFREKYGYELTDHLAALIDASYPGAPMIRYQYDQCTHELLRDRYHKTLSEWCAQNGIKYTTEVPSMRMSNQRYSHVPGGDPCHDKLGFPMEKVIDRDFHIFRSNPKVISAMARQFDRRDCLVESFHSIGWSMTLQDAKWQIDRQTLMGISLHTFHGFYYTVDGITKHDAPPSQFFQNPYWQHYRLFADYCARSSRLITETESMADVALLHPATSWWTHLRNPFSVFSYSGDSQEEKQASDQLIEDWKHLCKALLFHQIDYDDLDPEVMLAGRIEAGHIVVGRARYKTLVIPPITNLEGSAADMIRQFAAGGGTVICCGLSPYETIEPSVDPSTFLIHVPQLSKDVYFGEPGQAKVSHTGSVCAIRAPGGIRAGAADELLAGLVRSETRYPIDVNIPAHLHKAVIVHRRQNDVGSYLMLSSQDGVRATVALTCADAPESAALFELDLETGGCRLLESCRDGRTLSATVQLSPWQTRLFALADRQSHFAAPPMTTALPLTLETKLPMPVCAAGWNAYRLEQIQVSIDQGPFFQALPATFIEHFKQAGPLQTSQLQIDGDFGTRQSLSIRYPRNETCQMSFFIRKKPGKAFLLRDRMSIMGEHTIQINGHTLDPQAFQPQKVYDPCNLLADVTENLTEGVNTVSVSVTATADFHGLSDPLYLIGDFAVTAHQGVFVIDTPQKEACLTAGPIEGYPFYSGTLTFSTNLEIARPVTEGRFSLSLADVENLLDCVELIVNGTSLGVRAFAPYAWSGASDLLRTGNNAVQIRLTNTLANLFEGTWYDLSQQKMCAIQPG